MFIVTRNGEHLQVYGTRKAAQECIERNKKIDQKLVVEGWITNEQAKRANYSILERKQ